MAETTSSATSAANESNNISNGTAEDNGNAAAPTPPQGVTTIKPADFHPPLPLERFVLHEAPDEEEGMPADVAIVGGGPAGLACAIELARLVRRDPELDEDEVEIAVLEKAGELGEHSLSGAVVNPVAFRELFPDLKDEDFPFRGPVPHEKVYFLTGKRAWRVPTPPTMRNRGNYVGSLCEMVRWLGEKAEEAGVTVVTGFPAESLLVEGERVRGVRTAPAGLERDGSQGNTYEPGTDISAKITVLAEGVRGHLTQSWLDWQTVRGENPQIYALGVKELWEVKQPLDTVVHTLGWPLDSHTFGGSFLYPMGEKQVALGLVAGLDYPNARFDIAVAFQRMKEHPLFRKVLEGGEMLEWGAKSITEGGYFSLPARRHGDGCLLVGESAGFVDVPSLKGIHYAMHSGILAARTIFEALKKGDTSKDALAGYDTACDESYIIRDLYRTRNMRLAFKHGLIRGGAAASVMMLSSGALLGDRIPMHDDAWAERAAKKSVAQGYTPDGTLTFPKLDAVFKSGNTTRDDIPQHLVVGDSVPPELADFYAGMCPAGVYEREGDKLVVNAPNCVDCKATDVLGPRWTPREGGSGPKYRGM